MNQSDSRPSGSSFQTPTNPVYFSRLLQGLESAHVADEIKVRLSLRAFVCAKNECGRDIANLLGSATDMLPKDAVDVLMALATERRDSEEEAWRLDSGNGQPYYGGDIYTNGINTTRGQAAEAVAELIEKGASTSNGSSPLSKS